MNHLFRLLSVILIILFYSCTPNPGTPNVVPNAPSQLAASIISPSQVNLTWTDNSNNESGFKLERKTTATNYSVIATITLNNFTDVGLDQDSVYIYRVNSYNSAGNSAYSNEVSVYTNPVNPGPVISIGSQIWTQRNLDVSIYNNGDPIPEVTDPLQWSNLTTGAWCYLNNDPANGPIFGKLYNWFAVMDPRGLAPQGWHIPSGGDWATLGNFLGGYDVAGAKMKDSMPGSSFPLDWATNSSGFTGLMAGRRMSGGDFDSSGDMYGFWWSTTFDSPYTNVLDHHVSTISPYLYKQPNNQNNALSVRCLKN